jgi:hypothetical protein
MSTEAYYQAKEIGYKDGLDKGIAFHCKKNIYIWRTKKALEKINEGMLFKWRKSVTKIQDFFFMFKASVLFQLDIPMKLKQIIIMLRNYKKFRNILLIKSIIKVLEHASYIIFYEQKKAQIPET